jgi:hypothetical protein
MNNPRKHFRFQLNIGFVVFAIIFVYLTINIVVSLLKDNISVCRVEEGQIVNSASFTGVCIRDEEVVYASGNGYISFYVGEGDKVASSGNIYLLSANTPVSDGSVTDDSSLLDTLAYSDIRDQVTVFSNNYSDSQFSQIYSLKYNLQSLSTEMVSAAKIQSYHANTSGGQIVTTTQSGIVSYSYDGYESLTVESVNKQVLSDSSYEQHQITPYTYVESGQPAYKLVHSHQWQIVIPLTDSQAAELNDVDSVNLTFKKDNIETTSDFSIYQGSDGMTYGVLSLNDYMVRYIADRYVDIEIVFEEASGLKIPTSALVSKAFYQVPIQYLIEDNRSYETGFYCERTNENGEIVADFRTTGIYYQDDDYFYLSMDDFSFGDYIGKVDSGSDENRFRIGATGELFGVYNINKGYTQYEIVKILYSNSDYCIVQENLSYSVSLYDNIILNGDTVTENQIVY